MLARVLVAPLLLAAATAGSPDWTQDWERGGALASCGDAHCVRRRLSAALDRALNATAIPLGGGVSLVRARRPAGPPPPGDDLLAKLRTLAATSDLSIELGNANDGRGKKKKYFEYAYLALLAAAVVVPLKLQGLALIAGKALLIAKVALALAGSALLKKLSSPEAVHRRVDEERPYQLIGYRDDR